LSGKPIAVFGQLSMEGFELMTFRTLSSQSELGPIFFTRNHKIQIIPNILFRAFLARFNVLKYAFFIVGSGFL
jgi:hypothetical protein